MFRLITSFGGFGFSSGTTGQYVFNADQYSPAYPPDEFSILTSTTLQVRTDIRYFVEVPNGIQPNVSCYISFKYFGQYTVTFTITLSDSGLFITQSGDSIVTWRKATCTFSETGKPPDAPNVIGLPFPAGIFAQNGSEAPEGENGPTSLWHWYSTPFDFPVRNGQFIPGVEIEAPPTRLAEGKILQASFGFLHSIAASQGPNFPTITRDEESPELFSGPETIDIFSTRQDVFPSPIVPVDQYDWWAWEDGWIHKQGREVEWEFETDTPKNIFLTITANDGAQSSQKMTIFDVPTGEPDQIGCTERPDGAFIMARAEGKPSRVVVRRLEPGATEGQALTEILGLSRPRLASAKDGRLVMVARNDSTKQFQRMESKDGGENWQ